MAWNKIGNLAALSLALIFAACGGDDAGNKSVSPELPLREVSSFYELGSCTLDHEGDSVFVIELNADYLCTNNNWINLTAIQSSSNYNGITSFSSSGMGLFLSSSNTIVLNSSETKLIASSSSSVAGASKNSSSSNKFSSSSLSAITSSSNTVSSSSSNSFCLVVRVTGDLSGKCNSTNVGQCAIAVSRDSSYHICKTKGWEISNKTEIDTYQWGKGEEGEIKKGNATNTYYVFRNGKWVISKKETALGLCSSINEGEVGQYEEYGVSYHICDNGNWREATVLEYDTYGWEDGKNGEVRAGSVNSANHYLFENGMWQACDYRCDESFWERLGVCTNEKNGEVVQSDSGWYFMCENEKWRRMAAIEYYTLGKECLTDGTVAYDPVAYVCDGDSFRYANSMEATLGKGCVSYTEGKEAKKKITPSVDSIYSCTKGLWVGISQVTTYGTLVDERDKKTYKTVVIGSKTWMARNLNYRYEEDSNRLDSTSFCYDNDPANCNSYGRLYTWAAAMDSAGKFSANGTDCGFGKTCSPTYPVRGVCPKGWYLPTKADFDTLLAKANAGQYNAELILKSTSGWNNFNNRSGNGSDSYAFSAYPAGYRDLVFYEMSSGKARYNVYYQKGDNAYFWSSTENGDEQAYSMRLSVTNVGSREYEKDYKVKGFSVRCVKD